VHFGGHEARHATEGKAPFLERMRAAIVALSPGHAVS
jgi:hypothetical protein